MSDISGFGLKIRVIASRTFPAGFDVTQFADDGDPIDMPSLQIADKAMGLNGDLLTWSKANPIVVNLNVVPAGTDDRNLDILFQANRAGKGKNPARDIITIVAMYPNGQRLTLINGAITDGMPLGSVASAGRMKTKAYSFAFENYAAA